MPGWTSLFSRKKIIEDDFQSNFLDGVARILSGGSETETLELLRAEVKRAFDCEDISLFVHDPDDKPGPEEGSWALKVKFGLGEGDRVCEADASAMPSLVPGKRFPYSEQLASKAVLKAVALAYRDDTFYGCDIEKKIVLLQAPSPSDDLGSGDLSVLAIPLEYQRRDGRVLERTRVGVLALYKVATNRDVGDYERFLRSIVAFATTNPKCLLRDPITTLYTEAHLRDELGRYMSMFDLTGGKLQGGLVVGMVDALKVYKQTLETEANVDPARVSQHVSEVLRGVGKCVWRRSRHHRMGGRSDYHCGLAGRIGQEAFGVVLPLFKPVDLRMWAVKLARDVVEHDFHGEEHLTGGHVTVSQCAIPFGHPGARTPDEVWRNARQALEEIAQSQLKSRRDTQALDQATGTIRLLLEDGEWSQPGDYKSSTGRL